MEIPKDLEGIISHYESVVLIREEMDDFEKWFGIGDDFWVGVNKGPDQVNQSLLIVSPHWRYANRHIGHKFLDARRINVDTFKQIVCYAEEHDIISHGTGTNLIGHAEQIEARRISKDAELNRMRWEQSCP